MGYRATPLAGARSIVKWLQVLLLASGLAAFAWLLASADHASLWDQTLRLGVGGALAIVALGGLDQGLHALGWRMCFPAGAAPPAGPLVAAHLAGNAVNLVTPTATVGGEFVRATLLPEGCSTEAAVAALTVDRLTFAVSDALLGACGVLVLLGASQLDAWARYSLAAGAGLVVLGIAIFAALQRRGRLVALLTERGWLLRALGPGLADRLREAGGGVDARIAALHAESGASLLASGALHLAGAFMLLAQLACLVAFAGIPVSFVSLVEIFLVVTALDLASFFVPGRLGAQEGARMLAVSLAGLPLELGLLFSLAQRLEQAVWTAVGFALYSFALARRNPSGARS